MSSKKTQILAKDFFHELIDGRLSSANKILQRIKNEACSTEWQSGYLNALRGMLSASSSKNDKFVLINKIEVKEADKLTKIFSRYSKNRMQNEFDRGFFKAWVDYTTILKNHH